VLVFQPAEEALGGAAAMVADGVLEGVDMALGFHNQPDMPVGRFGYCRGSTLAGTSSTAGWSTRLPGRCRAQSRLPRRRPRARGPVTFE